MADALENLRLLDNSSEFVKLIDQIFDIVYN
jgi:hypothetical protein